MKKQRKKVIQKVQAMSLNEFKNKKGIDQKDGLD